jgi:hypothetical protein
LDTTSGRPGRGFGIGGRVGDTTLVTGSPVVDGEFEMVVVGRVDEPFAR